METRMVLSPTIYTVNSTGNGTAGSGASGSLPYVISVASTDPNPDGSEIEFDPTIFSSAQTINLSSTLVLEETNGPEVIDGPGAGLLSISGGGRVTVFDAKSGVTASLSGLTITGGGSSSSYFSGGGVYNAGTLTLSDCTITDSSASAKGGGLYSNGTVTLSDCTISGNTATDGYGGAGVALRGTATLTGCTISGNSAAVTGGGLSLLGTATLTGCTISGNSARGFGGGVSVLGTANTLTDCTIAGNGGFKGGGLWCLGGTTTLLACTISGNSSGAVGGLLVYGGATAVLTDSIVAGNIDVGPSSSTPSDIYDGTDGILTGTYDLIGPGGSGGLSGGTGGNIVLASLDGLGLGPLADNGGPTRTMALLPGSLAIGAGTAVAGVAADQRGQPLDSPPDIGAYQTQPGPHPIASLSPVLVVGQQPIFVRKLDKKGKPVGKPVLSGFTLEFSTRLDAGAATDLANYRVATITTKRVKKKVEHILHPISGFRVSYDAADDEVTITLGKPQKFPTGGQITLLGGLTSGADGGPLATPVFAIARGGKSIVPD